MAWDWDKGDLDQPQLLGSALKLRDRVTTADLCLSLNHPLGTLATALPTLDPPPTTVARNANKAPSCSFSSFSFFLPPPLRPF